MYLYRSNFYRKLKIYTPPVLRFPLDNNNLTQAKDKLKFKKQMEIQHRLKREEWRKFLRDNAKYDASLRFAIVEIPKLGRGFNPKQNIKGAVREACSLEGFNTQMLFEIKKSQNSKTGEHYYSGRTRGRVQNAALDLLVRQLGILYGKPAETFKAAGISEEAASQLDVIAFCRVQKGRNFGDVHYTIAVRLRANGEVNVLLPDSESTWIPYTKVGLVIGKLFHEARSDQMTSGRRMDSAVKLTGQQLIQFVARTLTDKLERPTIAVIEADGWRNAGRPENIVWPQLKNENLLMQKDVLDFRHVAEHNRVYQRSEPKLDNLLGIIRVRRGKETSQYVTDQGAWGSDKDVRDFTKLSGFIDDRTSELLHYFSVGRIPKTQQKAQDKPSQRGLYKLDEDGANTAFKHQQMVELVPFFIHPDYQMTSMQVALCRTIHYLRILPSWSGGNIISPFPQHLGQKLLDDYWCVLGIDT